uniref:Tripartite motif-containing protein 15 n=1 Tax=Neovison vison TaxID=452646 RepID=A0A8C7EQ35_NEOVI
MGAQLSCQVLPCVPCKEKEPVQPLVVPVPLGPLGQMRCEEHGEEIYFFCETDAELLCVVCREGPSHRTHPVAVLDGAVQPYRDCLWSQSRALRLDKSEMEATWQREDRKLQKLLTHIESKKQQVDAAFGKLQRELADQHSLLQARLRELEVQTCLERDQYNSKFSEEITRLGAQAQELEEQSQQPASVLLQVRPWLVVCRYETRTFVSPETISPDLVKKIRDLHWKTLFLPEMLRAFSGKGEGRQLSPFPTGGTAVRSRALTEDRKAATFIRDEQDLPHGPLSLGGITGATEGYSSTGYRNESEELEEEWPQENEMWPTFCLVGVARESVVRRGFLNVSPEEGFWTLHLSSAGMYTGTSPEPFQILSYCPRQIGVAPDYDGGKVTFSSARTWEFIYEFSSSFCGRIFPFLWLKCMRSRLRVRP